MECRQQANEANCNCSYPGCPHHAICCECIASHRRHGELPACYFPPEVERTYDRSIERYVQSQRGR